MIQTIDFKILSSYYIFKTFYYFLLYSKRKVRKLGKIFIAGEIPKIGYEKLKEHELDIYSGDGLNKSSISVPVYDGTLLNFVKEEKVNV